MSKGNSIIIRSRYINDRLTKNHTAYKLLLAVVPPGEVCTQTCYWEDERKETVKEGRVAREKRTW